MFLTAVLIPAAEGGFVAYNPETGTTTQGESVPEAISNLREATELYLEEFPLEQTGQAEIFGVGVGLDLSPYYSKSQALDLSASVTNEVFRDIVTLIAGQRRR